VHVYRGERGSARLLLPVVEKHVARDSKEPRLLALAVFVSISGPDDAEVDVLSQVVGEIRLAGEPAQIAPDSGPVPLEHPGGHGGAVARRRHMRI